MPPSAVTFTSSIIIILTLVHPFATSWPSSPKGDARTLRDWLSVSYGMISTLVISRCVTPPYPAAPDFPPSGGQNKTPRDNLLINPPLEMTVAADSGHPPANACYPAKGTLKGISIQNTHASMTWFSKSAAGVIVEGAGRKDVSFPIISFEEAYYGELQSL